MAVRTNKTEANNGEHTGSQVGETCQFPAKTTNHDYSQKMQITSNGKENDNEGNNVNCDYCDSKFSTKSMLVKHLRICVKTSETSQPYKCPTCHKAFAALGNCNLHQRIHTGEKPYKCPTCTCGKSFRNSGNCKSHQRIHTGEKPYKCPTCGKSFSDMSASKRHQRIHTGEKTIQMSYLW